MSVVRKTGVLLANRNWSLLRGGKPTRWVKESTLPARPPKQREGAGGKGALALFFRFSVVIYGFLRVFHIQTIRLRQNVAMHYCGYSL